jgi:nitrite reductase (NO-forming)
MSLPQTKEDLMQAIHDMGGLELVMPKAFAETDCGALENSGRQVHNFQLTGNSVDLPILGHTADNPKTYKAMTFSQQIPGPTVRVTQGDVIKMTLTIPADEPTAHGNDMHAS